MKGVVDATRSPEARYGGTVVDAVQVVIVAGEIPTQAIVHSEVRPHAPGVLGKQSPRPLHLVKIKSAEFLILVSFGIDGLTPRNDPDVSSQNGVVALHSADLSRRCRRQRWIAGVEDVVHGIAGPIAEDHVVIALGRVPVVILLAVEAAPQGQGMRLVLPD